MELRTRALQALQLIHPDAKCEAVQQLWVAKPQWSFGSATIEPGTLPGRPPEPRLIPPGDVPTRSPFTPEGRAALVHAICHIEFNAINLALDAVWRFDGMPEDFYRDWMRVAYEEAQHFDMLHRQLQAMGHRYGDFDAHDGLWEMCEKTADDITARMALVPRTLEARGLDATPLIQTRLRKVGTPDALRIVECLDVILREEIGHVEIGNRWYRWLCERQGLEPVAHYKALVVRHRAPRLRPPFNTEARQAAGFSPEEIAYLAGDGLSPGV
ncbi:MAG: ferritin-like domain-containing protein [Limnohabitans sp.]|nr:MAG: ferritin-like domain-containing protein [Limnohabitans sp.]